MGDDGRIGVRNTSKFACRIPRPPRCLDPNMPSGVTCTGSLCASVNVKVRRHTLTSRSVWAEVRMLRCYLFKIYYSNDPFIKVFSFLFLSFFFFFFWVQQVNHQIQDLRFGFFPALPCRPFGESSLVSSYLFKLAVFMNLCAGFRLASSCKLQT